MNDDYGSFYYYKDNYSSDDIYFIIIIIQLQLHSSCVAAERFGDRLKVFMYQFQMLNSPGVEL
jgi:hypothetical protein